MSDHNYKASIKRLGIDDSFVEHGTPEELLALLGLDAEGIANSIGSFIQNT